jgi:hypothetical protein
VGQCILLPTGVLPPAATANVVAVVPFAAPLVWLLKVTKIKVGMVYGKDFGYAKGVKCEVTLTDGRFSQNIAVASAH